MEAIADYYAKGTTDAGELAALPIEDGNVFTHCPDCGEEHATDRVELANSGDIDLYGRSVYFETCTKKRQERRGE